jgi:hypothetical protein
MLEKVYHIYAKEKCLYHSLKEEEFYKTWNTLLTMVDLTSTEYRREDLDYEELIVNKKVISESSH